MQQALMEAKSVEQPHRLTLDSRSRLSVTGVLEVESFDETEILLTSTRGPLSIRGQGLRLQQLSIARPSATKQPMPANTSTHAATAARGGFFARLFG